MASLGHDLKTLRKQQDLDLSEVQERTKIPAAILKSIENDSIFERINTNTTYTRSYVRSYARAVGIEEQAIIQALNQVQRSEYQGGLLDESSANAEEASLDESEADHEPQENEAESTSTPTDTPPAKKIYPHSARKESSKKWNWANVSQKATPEKSDGMGEHRLVLFLILVLVCAGGFLFYYYYLREPEPAKNRTPSISRQKKPPAPSDSLRQALANTEEDSQTSAPKQTTYQALPDTLRLSIFAESGKLEPVRVYTDLRGKRNPYWVSRGDTISFNFVNTIRVRAVNQYARLQLIFNGHIIPNAFQQYYDKQTDAIQITRNVIEQHKNWW